MKRTFALLLALVILPLGACALSGPVYEVFVASFSDADGDLRGDLKGVENMLPYIESLQAKGLWLMPINPSPSYHKYDVVNYTDVDPAYGTLDDFGSLAAACREKDIALIVDLVINHTSSQHPWFISACQSLTIDPCGRAPCAREPLCREHNPYVDYYLFSHEPVGHSVPGAETWYYVGGFGPHMPDLNLDSAAVRDEIEAIARFWLDRGAAGFRLDAVTSYYEKNGAKNTVFLKWFTEMVKAHRKDAFLVGEAWTDANNIFDLYASGLDSLFYFPMAGPDGLVVKAMRSKDGAGLARILSLWNNRLLDHYPTAQNAPFLGNHDMGRIAGVLRRDVPTQKQAAAMYLLLPGVPFLYYGEEIGMTGSGKDENKRLPMLWRADGEGLCLPPSGADQVQKLEQGVLEQQDDPDSLLTFYRELLAFRATLPEMNGGRMAPLDLGNKDVAAYTVTLGEYACTVLNNLGDEPVSLSIVWPGTMRFSFGGQAGSAWTDETTLTLPPRSGCIFN